MMDPRFMTYLTKMAGGALLIAGVVVVLIGYVGIRDESSVELQLPYLASGGIGGLALIGIGIAAYLKAGLKEQTQHVAEVVESLEGWKASALAEMRDFLESAEVQLDVEESLDPKRAVPRRRAASV
jgi:hypothetical protein